MVSSINFCSNGEIPLISQIKKLSMKNLAESYSKTDADKEKDIEEEIRSLMETADMDKSGGLSKEELSAIDVKDNPDKAKLIKNLLNGFDSYDTDDDMELSVSELKEVLKDLEKQFSERDIANMSKENEEFRNSNSSSMITYNSPLMVEKFISKYKM